MAGRVLEAGLHLLDRQLVDRDGRLAGKVDDLELEFPSNGGAPLVTAILAGPGSLSRRIGGRFGAFMEAVANRLRGGDDQRPAMGAEVLDEADGSAGRVHDVRLVQDGPLVGGFGAALRLDGLIVGKRAIGARLGYERGRMKGPLPVKLVTGWLFHDGRYVEWGRVRSIEPDRIMISGTVEDLPRPRPSS